MDAKMKVFNERFESKMTRLINKENHLSEIASNNLKRIMNPIIIQNNHTICYICQKEVSVEYCKTFSCDHLICIPCISKLIIRENFSSLLNKYNERDELRVNFNCFCGQGNISLDYQMMQRELNEAIYFNKSKEIKCHKHFEIAKNYCFNCSNEICDKCIEEHNKEYKKNKKLKKHNIIKIEECEKNKNHIPKIKFNEIELNIASTKNKIEEFFVDEEQILNNEIDKIIKNLEDIKSNYKNSLNQKIEFINKLLEFFLSAYKLYYKECECDINELSMKNLQLTENIFTTFNKIDFIPKALNFSKKLNEEIEKITKDSKSFLEFEYKFDFNYRTYSSHHELTGHKNSINCLCTFQNKYIASGSSDNTINIYDCSSNDSKIKPIKKLSFHVDSINSIIAIDNGNYLLSSGRDDKLCLWDVKEILENNDINEITLIPTCFEQIQETKKIYPKKYVFSESISVYCLCLLSNNKIAIAGRDETIKIVDKDLKQINTILTNEKGPILSIAEFDKNLIISGGMDSFVKIYDISKKKCVCLDKYIGHRGQVNCVIKLKNNKDLFCSAGKDGYIRILTYDTQKEKKCIELVGKLEGHEGEIFSLVELLDGRIASGSADWTIKIWDVNNKICVQTLIGQNNSIFSLAQLNDGRLISGYADKSLILWN